MHDVVNRLIAIKREIQTKSSSAEVVAVSKTFPMTKILPLINHGHKHFGENKVQEAIEKWTSVKEDFVEIKLHLIGKLQTNKVKYAVPLFDYIHSLDSQKLAEKIANEQEKKNRKVKIFIQINIGNEAKKNGIEIENLENFYDMCNKEYKLDIIGLMCLPPMDKDPGIYFSKMYELINKINLNELSMGMSNDYMEALKYKSTFLRIGSQIFGSRN
tara:strand:- start:1550 stop:2194 length:645 start_codon:yes stop_codon:yes gene_type:complete